MKYFIYKYVENNEIVYIGQTIHLQERISQHSRESNFINFNGKIFYFTCNNRTEMDAYEYFLINKYQPKYNIQFKNKIEIIDFSEPQWVLFTQNCEQSSSNNPTQHKTITATEVGEEEYISIKEFAELNNITPQAIYKPNSKYHPYIKYSPELKKRVISKRVLEQINKDYPPIIETNLGLKDACAVESNNELILQNIIKEQKQEIEFLKKIINSLTTKE